MGRLEQPCFVQPGNSLVHVQFFIEVEMRRGAVFNADDLVQVFGAVNIVAAAAYQVQQVAFFLEIEGNALVHAVQDTHHTDGWRRIHRAFGRLVIETYVTAGNGSIEFAAGFAHALHGVYKLVIYFRVVRVAEVQAVGDGYRFAAGANNVAGCFRHSDLAAFMGVGKYVPAVTVGRHSQCLLCWLYQYNSRIAGSVGAGVSGAYHAVVLLIDPPFGCDVRQSHHSFRYKLRVIRIRDVLDIERLYLSEVSRFGISAVVLRCAAAQHHAFCRNVCFQLAVHIELQVGIFCYLADLYAVKVPFIEDIQDFFFLSFLHDYEHAFLAFAQQHFPCLHIFLAGRHLIQPDVHAMLAFGAHFRGGTGDTGCAHILHANNGVGFNDFQAGFQ